MKKCKNCNGTGQVPKEKGSDWKVGWFTNAQMDGLVKKTDICPKCYGKGRK